MYLAIAGNIGSGKSSLTALLSEAFGLKPVYEAVSENPYLEDFYRDMGAYAFHSQVFFLARRVRQHLLEVNGARAVVQDRTVYEDALVFAQNLYREGHLKERDWRTYLDLFQSVSPALRKPDLLIYLRASLPTLRERIKKRGRPFEQNLPDRYLLGLNALYEQLIASWDLSPVYVVEADRIDFVEKAEDRDSLLAALRLWIQP
ncbi:deoxynucleoside kinase [Thermus scotoductus]|jgi:deoxyadenosine/deoxycytidine kinase|uniref:Deoxyguanosine kinase n=2 Tax=Thermus scotoductus TaxID=37636 RepID=A0A0N1KQ50_THESC|nr:MULTISPECIES: deoxynucleoside kinase [Thermus]ADW22482.1 putative deoxynucleoside kinase subfamily [Thermus scotoductus SA-01]ETN88918.1 deoxyguanosine kinase [Thermus sp. NMX2.A1]KPD28277.1 deoxyguanosine kinase [Thermus scotoductus]RTG91919.1 deoxynucleoside kinase [Thermus scotoductus]RTG96120.1 deoxynucleoside kinase [Thermus scotoductus]